MKSSLKTTARLVTTNTNLNREDQVWQVWDNCGSIHLSWDNHHGGLTESESVIPILNEEYIEKGNALHMYFAYIEQIERKKKWEKVFTNLSMI